MVQIERDREFLGQNSDITDGEKTNSRYVRQCAQPELGDTQSMPVFVDNDVPRPDGQVIFLGSEGSSNSALKKVIEGYIQNMDLPELRSYSPAVVIHMRDTAAQHALSTFVDSRVFREKMADFIPRASSVERVIASLRFGRYEESSLSPDRRKSPEYFKPDRRVATLATGIRVRVVGEGVLPSIVVFRYKGSVKMLLILL